MVTPTLAGGLCEDQGPQNRFSGNSHAELTTNSFVIMQSEISLCIYASLT